jgi:hypothetical protein
LSDAVRAVPLEALGDRGRYDIVKACYHFSLELVEPYAGPLVCRLVRVVDERAPARDDLCRPRLLACQCLARERAWGMVFNNAENAVRWRDRYGERLPIALVPTGCPARLPPAGPDPYAGGRPAALFLGSLVGPRMAAMLNGLAERLRGRVEVHVIGRDKGVVYGTGPAALSPLVVRHGELPEAGIWDFVRCARAGIALSVGPDRFDNDLSKITTYLRGGLPVVCEAGVLNAGLATGYGLGRVISDDDPAALAEAVCDYVNWSEPMARRAVMGRVAVEHSWDQRAVVLDGFLRTVVAAGSRECGPVIVPADAVRETGRG